MATCLHQSIYDIRLPSKQKYLRSETSLLICNLWVSSSLMHFKLILLSTFRLFLLFNRDVSLHATFLPRQAVENREYELTSCSIPYCCMYRHVHLKCVTSWTVLTGSLDHVCPILNLVVEQTAIQSMKLLTQLRLTGNPVQAPQS